MANSGINGLITGSTALDSDVGVLYLSLGQLHIFIRCYNSEETAIVSIVNKQDVNRFRRP